MSLALVAGAGGACARGPRAEARAAEPRPRGATVPSDEPPARGGGPSEVATVLSTVAHARCEREARCAELGPGRAHVTHDSCVVDRYVTQRAAYDPVVCARGVDPAALAACAEAARRAACAPAATATDDALCTWNALCRAAP